MLRFRGQKGASCMNYKDVIYSSVIKIYNYNYINMVNGHLLKGIGKVVHVDCYLNFFYLYFIYPV